MVRLRFLIIFIFGLFFLIYPRFIFAQVFSPETVAFDSSLDGCWEFGEVVNNYLVTEVNETNLLTLNFTTSKESNGDFLVNNKTSINFSLNQLENLENIFFEFSFECETSEDLIGFDQPFLVLFYGDELIYKETDLQLCFSTQTRSFLLPVNNSNELIFFAGNNGDLENSTTVEFSNFSLFYKPVVVVKNSNALSIIPTTVPANIVPSHHLAPPYPTINKVIHNLNKKPEITGQVLGEKTAQPLTFKDYLPPYFYLIVGLLVTVLSLPIFISLSGRCFNLFSRKEKNETT
ncbi:MAG: hypothetical protein IT416_04105 [Candidatus Pacebacteria bacterium]|nr:hypothetical protein [Candidatus Paceibacterota bacterium]